MTEWDWIRHREFRGRGVAMPRGLSGMSTSSASVSPYDVPDAMRAYMRPDDSSMFTIEFRYATAEPIEYRKSGAVTLGIGRNSGRLYQICAKVQDIAPRDTIRVAIGDASNAIDVLVQDEALAKRKQNYGIAKELLSTHVSERLESKPPHG